LSVGGEVLFEGDNPKPVNISTLPKPFSGKGWFNSYLYKSNRYAADVETIFNELKGILKNI
jgi:hypothetical protein